MVEYFLSCAKAELELAQSSTDPGEVAAHYQMAGYYLERLGEYLDQAYRPRPQAAAFKSNR
jgi:hypothetical protein